MILRIPGAKDAPFRFARGAAEAERFLRPVPSPLLLSRRPPAEKIKERYPVFGGVP